MKLLNTMRELILYQFQACPFCEKVRNVLDNKHIKYEKVNVPRERNTPERLLLFNKSGVWTVPVLKIDEEYIGESQDIIDYLEEHFLK